MSEASCLRELKMVVSSCWIGSERSHGAGQVDCEPCSGISGDDWWTEKVDGYCDLNGGRGLRILGGEMGNNYV